MLDKSKSDTLIKKIRNPFIFRFFLWQKLPAAFWSGVQLQSIDYTQATASVPFKRFTQNPFRSTYFACLAMAAELATGVFGMIALAAAPKKVSMLVVKLEAEYFKKATERIYFTCVDGDKIFAAIEKTIATGEATEVKCESIGKNAAGELIAKFYLTWSYKAKAN